ncbi:hypothetical protein HGH92_26490 [Chitinophaga varians]|uniref:Terpene synthase n=1 Tax=Chitinophaga varians TaxID=2202339 RepID=A0A847S864_9BACT|nr:terpene synthase family protein [Chitinophaga varians]NLR67881.1 hypothetical protein [Chitinophaga varians]
MQIPIDCQLSYPFNDELNRHAVECETMTQQWIETIYAFLPPNVREKYSKTKTGLLTARFFPRASLERLTPMVRSSLWGLAWDDYNEYSNEALLLNLKQKVVDVLSGVPLLKYDELFSELRLMYFELSSIMPEYWMKRFCRSMAGYLDGMIEESRYKKRMEFPSLDDYIRIRTRSVDVYPLIDFVEVVTEQPLPDFVRHSPEMEVIAYYICRIIAWANDFFSAPKERGRDVMNMVLVLMHHNGVSWEDAYKELLNIHAADVKKYQQLKEDLPSFGDNNRAVKNFLVNCDLLIAGHKIWYEIDTLRYKSGGSPEPGVFQ